MMIKLLSLDNKQPECFHQAFPDNAARREVEALAAVCPNEGCSWTGSIKEYEVENFHFCFHYCPTFKNTKNNKQ